jgi:S-adenosylmethionine:tRNA ribosyltransferase-isomerase
MALIDDIRALRIADYDYPLPDERIAKHPLAQREQCKLLYYHGGAIEERVFKEVPSLLPDCSTLIYNNTRVINARLRFRKETGSTVEIFCLEPVLPRDYEQIFQTTGHCVWQCLVGNSKRWKQGALTQTVTIDDHEVVLAATRGEQRGNAWEIAFDWDGKDGQVTFADVLGAIGEIPIPPYLNRGTEESDSTDYQTVYSHIDGSVAAPTAGLHFTDEVLAECDTRGIRRREITLHVGAGTFQPVKSEHIGDHPMHYEFISVPRDVIMDIINAPGPIIAVGTTSVRTLESLYYMGILAAQGKEELHVPQWMPYETVNGVLSTVDSLQALLAYMDKHHLDVLHSSTQIIIAPGYEYHIVRRMVTNFHQPQSTLLLLVSAFLKGDWKKVYDYALSHDFRFLSYGDSSLLIP